MTRPTARATPHARTIDLDPWRDLTVRDAGRRLTPRYGPALARLPRGRQVFRGLPFDLGRPAGRGGPRWLLVDRPVSIQLVGAGPTSHVVVAHLCDTWRDEEGRRPAGLPIGHVVPVGQALARYTVEDRAGHTWSRVIRRRFEVNDGLLGWGSMAFASVSHQDNEVADWRGPHAAQTPGRYAPAGQSGSLTIMPGTYGANQVGMTDFVPSPTDDLLLWLHAIALDGEDVEPTVLHVEPLAADRPGSLVVLAAVTLFHGHADPLVRGPRMTVRIEGSPSASPEVDLGVVIRSRPALTSEVTAPAPAELTGAPPLEDSVGADAGPIGWGTSRSDSRSERDARIVDLATAPDAILGLDDWHVRVRDLLDGAPIRDPAGTHSIEVLPDPVVPVEVDLVDPATGDRIAGRVRFTAADGRYLAPEGHRDEVNPGFFEDTGGDLILGSSTYAYVPGSFAIGLPPGRVDVEAVAGFERRPIRRSLVIEPSTRRVELALARIPDAGDGQWMTADSHVHFLAPSTALLQAAAEDVDLVNLLAAQWGDLFTNVTDLPWGSIADPRGRHRVVVGTENRQNMLGHLALLGANRPTQPLASGGPPEGRMGGPLSVLLADWADRCRAAGGLVVGAHFPLPYAEIAADIVAGKIDAIEAQALSPGLDDPTITEWYRYLDLGERLPIVAGTDKMSAEVPVGAVRTYTHLLHDDHTFERWAEAVRAGRTFVTSGPLIELTVDGCRPGDVVRLPGRGHLPVGARAWAAQPVVAELELVVNGRVAASVRSAGPNGATDLTLEESVSIEAGSWIAARSRSASEIHSAFRTSMAAHTSPVYVEVAGRPLIPRADDVAVVEQVMLGARTWLADLAAVAEPSERTRMIGFLDAMLERLRARLTAARH